MRYFLTGRPFRDVPTKGLHFLVVGQCLILLVSTGRLTAAGVPATVLEGLLCALSSGAWLLLLLVVQAAVREYAGRSDKPRPFWKLPNLLE